jgi:hypothetical protein
MKQVHPNYTFNATTKTITLTGLNIDQDQLLLVTNATRGIIYYNFASSSHRAVVTAGANTMVVLTDASTTGHADSDQLVIHYEDQHLHPANPTTFTYTNNTTSTSTDATLTNGSWDTSRILKSIVVGTSCTAIGAAFSRYISGYDEEGHEIYVYSESLLSVTIPNSVTSIGNGAFSYCTSLASVTIPDSVTSIEDYAFYNCFSLASVTIPDRVTSIEDYAFYNCFSLASVTIGSSVTSIGDYAFSDCTSLASITIPDSVRSIGVQAFYNCFSLASVTIGSGMTSIGDTAFYVCTGLTSITIPNSVTSIGVQAFSSCTSLASVTIPNSVRSIGGLAFYGCTSLASITMQGNAPTVGTNVFLNTSASLTIYYCPSSYGFSATLGGKPTSATSSACIFVQPVGGTITADSNRGTLSAPATLSITTAATSQEVFASNASRKYLVVQNLSDTVMYLGVGFTPNSSTPQGLLLSANGGGIVFESNFIPTQAVNIVCATAGKRFQALQG